MSVPCGLRRDACRHGRHEIGTGARRASLRRADSKTSPVEDAVRAIVKALTTAKPAARYLVGRDVKLVLPLLRRFPVGLRDRLVMSNLGLGRDAFDMASTPAEPGGD